MSVPPELMAVLQQAQGGNADAGFPAPEAGFSGMPPEQQGFAPPEAPAETPEDILNQMIELAKKHLTVENDPGQLAKMTKVLDSLMQKLAQEQKEMNDALGGKMSPRLMARSLSG